MDLHPRYDVDGNPGNAAARFVDACTEISEGVGDVDVDDVARVYAIAASILAAHEEDGATPKDGE